MKKSAILPAGGINFILVLTLLFAFSADCAFAAVATFTEPVSQSSDIEVFVRDGCPHCAKAKEFLSALQLQYSELRIVVRDVQADPAALEKLKRLADSQLGSGVKVPAFSVGGQLIV